LPRFSSLLAFILVAFLSAVALLPAPSAVVVVLLEIAALIAAPFLVIGAALAFKPVVRGIRDTLPNVLETAVLVVVLTVMGTLAVVLRRCKRSARSCQAISGRLRTYIRPCLWESPNARRARYLKNEGILMKMTQIGFGRDG